MSIASSASAAAPISSRPSSWPRSSDNATRSSGSSSAIRIRMLRARPSSRPGTVSGVGSGAIIARPRPPDPSCPRRIIGFPSGRTTMTAREIRAPRGTELACRSWPQEAAMRMLMNNLDPEVAERPEDLVVYGGTGRAARSWEAYDAIVATLKDLGDDETLLVQSGKPVAVFRTHDLAPMVLI